MLTPVEQALAQILNAVPEDIGNEIIDISLSLGRVLVDDIVSPIDVPPWPNSAMDGYAVRLEDIVEGKCYPVSQYITAGVSPEPLEQGSCARIFTGAPIPDGANAVIMQENATVSEDGIRFLTTPALNDHIRQQAQDMSAGQHVFDKGRRLSAADVSVLASLGLAEVAVKKQPKVALVSTGDELQSVGQPLARGQIYSSNSYMLAAILGQLGCEVVATRHIMDDLGETKKALTELASSADLVISSGGASVGEADFIYQALTEVGKVDLWKLAIKPGKPLLFGAIGATPFFGLPGNPSSSFVTFIVVVLPFLKAMLGEQRQATPIYAKTDFAWPKPGSRQEYVRVQHYHDGYVSRVRAFSNQSSGVVLSTAWANALAIVPIGASFQEDTVIEIIPLPI